MPTGEITYFDAEKQFGFIETGATKDNVYFRADQVPIENIDEGVQLKFDITPPESRDKNPAAKNITLD